MEFSSISCITSSPDSNGQMEKVLANCQNVQWKTWMRWFTIVWEKVNSDEVHMKSCSRKVSETEGKPRRSLSINKHILSLSPLFSCDKLFEQQRNQVKCHCTVKCYLNLLLWNWNGSVSTVKIKTKRWLVQWVNKPPAHWTLLGFFSYHHYRHLWNWC